jgi:hypothetical protein
MALEAILKHQMHHSVCSKIYFLNWNNQKELRTFEMKKNRKKFQINLEILTEKCLKRIQEFESTGVYVQAK